jgi:hypothetical protein
MRQPDRRWLLSFALAGLLGCAISGAADAQGLWKYTDKDGKVTYSDKPPKKGETAQLVTADPSANIIDAPTKAGEGNTRRSEERESKGRKNERDRANENLRAALEAAKAELDAAKAALESGKDPLPSETQIIVGRNKAGDPTGANSIMRKPEYYSRIAALEEAVKKAEEKVDTAEKNFRKAGP